MTCFYKHLRARPRIYTQNFVCECVYVCICVCVCVRARVYMCEYNNVKIFVT